MNILFLCVANSARSQMAEGLARRLFNGKAVIASAGSEPSRVNPFAIQAMKNIGIDISTHHSKAISEVLSENVDLVVTLCADEVCPVVPELTNKQHWPFSDPADTKGTDQQILSSFEAIRDQILKKLMQFGKDNDLVDQDLQMDER